MAARKKSTRRRKAARKPAARRKARGKVAKRKTSRKAGRKKTARKKSASKMASGPTTWGYLLLALKYSKWFGVRRGFWKRRIAEHDARRVAASHTEERPLPCAASQAA